MKKTIDLNMYIKLGGDVALLDLAKTRVTYHGWDKFTIHSIRENGGLYFVVFTNGRVHNFAPTWIETEVILTLESHYKPKNANTSE